MTTVADSSGLLWPTYEKPPADLPDRRCRWRSEECRARPTTFSERAAQTRPDRPAITSILTRRAGGTG